MRRALSLHGDPEAPAPRFMPPDGEELLAAVGLLDIEAHRRLCGALGGTVQVYLDGKDVTMRCFRAHDEEGWADLWDQYHGRNVAVRHVTRGLVCFTLRRVAASTIHIGPAGSTL